MTTRFKRGDLVYIGKGRKVFRVHKAWPPNSIRDHTLYMIEASADHPDAGKRLPDAFKNYRDEELSAVSL